MRQFFPILALLFVVSCNKQADIPARQEVTFGAHLVDASSMTRPVDTTFAEAVTYRFSWDGADYKGNPTYKMEPGKYYVLHPDTVTELEGLFALEFAEWTCGME